ncbi:MFS transporter [Lacisediminihabitans profunda]|uniref:MFS transporter n=1 Tax=Lacisediminihabitans profunda TaxID=2594790 RepID=A0A5C8UQ54_9MICO|nr:MFS transporter [Lacisediminihabitans profunda]TXN30587.1 MFS transporter [Lacisediminihabitans profunda]
MLTLSARASFWSAAVVAGLALWASGAPTVVYPLYAAEWNLTPTVTTAIFAAYPIVLIPVLIVFGNLSDFIGRRATILIGLTALALGSAVFGLAPDLGWVFVGRALMGVGVGLSLSPATAAMIEFGGPSRAHRASSTTTAATATGLALATTVGGALVQYAPQPLHLTFWVLVLATVITGALAWFFPRHTRDEAVGHWRPRTLAIPAGSRREFAAGTLGISAAFSMGGVFLALGAQIARQLIRSDNALVNGAILSISAVVIGVVAILSRRLAVRISLTAGPIALAAGLGALIGSGVTHSLILFILASVLSGAGYSLMFSGGLATISASAPVRHRGAVISAAYVIGYLLQAISALGLGALATGAGLLPALEIGAPLLVALGVASLLLANAPRRRRDSAFA